MRRATIRERRVMAAAAARSTPRRRLQRDVLRDVMLSAGQCDTWLTLDELARLTGYPPASISAQLRHLRKPRYGGFELRKRCRPLRRNGMGAVDDRLAHGPLWEYRVNRFAVAHKVNRFAVAHKVDRFAVAHKVDRFPVAHKKDRRIGGRRTASGRR